jgi:hypothetical protein
MCFLSIDGGDYHRNNANVAQTIMKIDENWLKIMKSNQQLSLLSHVSLFGSLYYKMVSQRQTNDAFLVPGLTPEVRMVNMPLETSDQHTSIGIVVYSKASEGPQISLPYAAR